MLSVRYEKNLSPHEVDVRFFLKNQSARLNAVNFTPL